MKHTWRKLGLLLGVALIGGGTSPLVKYGLQVFPPFVLLAMRFWAASAVLLPFAWGELRALKREQIRRLISLSFLATANVVLFSYGIRMTTAIIGQTLYVGVPIMTLILAYGLKTENVARQKVIGVLVGLVGSLAIILLPAWDKGSVMGGRIEGNLLIALAVVCFTFYSVWSKKSQETHSPLVVTTMFMLVTAIVASVIAPFEAVTASWWSLVTWQSLVSVIYLGAIGSGVFYWLYQYAIKLEGATFTTFVFYLLPVATFLWAYLLLGELLTVAFVLGAVLIFWGAWIAGKK